MAVLLLAVVLLLCDIQVYSYTLTGCSTDSNFEIAENQPTSITCTGLGKGHNIYWSITWPSDSVETRIGDCSVCSDSSPCPHNCSDVKADFSITRTLTESTLYFVHNLNANDGAIIKCSQRNNNLKFECDVIVIKAYRLLNCENNTLEVVDDGKTEIICTGIDRSQSMYWSIRYPDGTTDIIAKCQHCDARSKCPDCEITFTDYHVVRSPKESTLQLTGVNDRAKDGATLKCSKKDNITHSECQMKVLNYNLPQCKNGQLDVSEAAPWTPIVCEDLRLSHNIKWQITDRNTQRVAWCDKGNEGFDCNAIYGFTASRSNGSVSELMIVERVRENEGKTLTCLRQDDAAAVKCELRVFYPGELHDASVIIDSNFTVLGHVDINKIYASHGNIACHWYYTQDNQEKNIMYTNLSFENFTENNDLKYQRGTCDVTIALDTAEASYKFAVDVQPGHGPVSAGTVIVRKPNGLQLNETTCPEYVAERSDLRCVCQHPESQQGSPAASIHWDNMTDTGVLEVTKVTRKQSGTQYLCTSLWAEGMTDEMRSSITYTLRVAYGPAKAELHVDNLADYDGEDTIRDPSNFKLTCMYDEAFPSANFSWDVNCTTFVTTPTLSICSLDLRSVMDVEKIECTVFNSEIPELIAKAYYTIPLAETGQNAENQSSDAGLAGGVSAAAAIALVVCIAVLLFRRRQKNFEMHKNVCYQGSDEVHIQSIIEANSSNHTMSQNSPSAPPPSHSQDTSLTETGESTTRHDNINSGTQNDGAVIALGAENHTYAQVKKTKKTQKPAGAMDDMHNLGDNNPSGKQTQDMEPNAEPKVPSPLHRKEANAAGYHDQTSTEPRDDGTNNKAEMSRLKEKSQKMTPKGNNHKTPGGHDGGSDSENVYSNCLAESMQQNPDTDVYINVAETTALANNQDNKVEQSAQINGCTNVQASQPQPTKHGDSNTNAQQQDADKSTEDEDVYQNVTPESGEAMGTNDDEYQSLQLSRQKQREDPTYSHLA